MQISNRRILQNRASAPERQSNLRKQVDASSSTSADASDPRRHWPEKQERGDAM